LLQSNLVTNDSMANLVLPNTGNTKEKSSSSDFLSLLNEISDNSNTTSKDDDSVNDLAASMLLFLMNGSNFTNEAMTEENTLSQMSSGSVGTTENLTSNNAGITNLLSTFGNSMSINTTNISDVVNNLLAEVNADISDHSDTKEQLFNFINEYATANPSNLSETDVAVSPSNLREVVATVNPNNLSGAAATAKPSDFNGTISTANSSNLSETVTTTDQNNLSKIIHILSQGNLDTASDGLSQGRFDLTKLANGIKEILENKGNLQDATGIEKLLSDLKSENVSDTSEKTAINKSAVNQIIPNNSELTETPKSNSELGKTLFNSLNVENISLNNGSSNQNASESDNESSFKGSGEFGANKDVLGVEMQHGNSQVTFSNYTLKNISDVKAEIGQVVKDTIVKNVFTVNALGKKDMEIQLSPDNLGKITIKLQSDQGQMNIKIYASNSEVKDAISVQTLQIVESMKEQGIKINHLDVVYSNLSSDLSNQHSRSSYQDTNRQSPGQAKAEYEQYSLVESEVSDIPLLYNGSVEYIV